MRFKYGCVINIINIPKFSTNKGENVKFAIEHAMKAHGRVEVYSSTISLTSALDGVGG
jgi:hypothetical protein